MSVSRLLEELVPFMDHSIDDPAAMRMSGGHHKRKQPSSKVHCQCADRLVLSMPSCLVLGPLGARAQCVVSSRWVLVVRCMRLLMHWAPVRYQLLPGCRCDFPARRSG